MEVPESGRVMALAPDGRKKPALFSDFLLLSRLGSTKRSEYRVQKRTETYSKRVDSVRRST